MLHDRRRLARIGGWRGGRLYQVKVQQSICLLWGEVPRCTSSGGSTVDTTTARAEKENRQDLTLRRSVYWLRVGDTYNVVLGPILIPNKGTVEGILYSCLLRFYGRHCLRYPIVACMNGPCGGVPFPV